MSKSTQENDSGSYVNGVYTSKNGNTSAGGLNCPKGKRLYEPGMKDAVFFMPEDRGQTEDFVPLTTDVAPGILPYYAISNYGRVLNIKSGKVMKPNYRPNGYEYLCLASDNEKHGQTKYTTHRLVMETFKPIDNPKDYQVDHINSDKTANYVDKTMPDGSVESNLRWCTPSENQQHRVENPENNARKVTDEDVASIRLLHQQGYSYEQIREGGYGFISQTTVQNICKNNLHKDPNYNANLYSESIYKNNPANVHKLTDFDVIKIRSLYDHGYNCIEIKSKFYPDFSASTISDIVRGISHNNDHNS